MDLIILVQTDLTRSVSEICIYMQSFARAIWSTEGALLSRKNLNYTNSGDISSQIIHYRRKNIKNKNLSVEQRKILKPYWTFSKYVNVISLNAMLYIVYINWDDQQDYHIFTAGSEESI